MRTPATHARHDRPDSQRAAAPLLACTHREDLPRHARALSRRGAARRLLPREGAGVAPRVLGFIITIPLVFPPVALGYMLLTALGRTSLVGGALEPFGLSLIFNETAVALAGFIAGLPLVVRPLQAAFASPRLIELEEAARIHGAGRRDVFLRITLPARAAESRGGAPSRLRPRLGRGGHHDDARRQHLGAHQHTRSKSSTPSRAPTSTPRTRSASLLALCGRHLPCGRAPQQAQPKALTSNARTTREPSDWTHRKWPIG